MSNNPYSYSKHNNHNYSPYTYYPKSRHQQSPPQPKCPPQPPKKIHINPNFTSAAPSSTGEPPIYVNVSNSSSTIPTSKVIVNPKVCVNESILLRLTSNIFSVPIHSLLRAEFRGPVWEKVSQDAHQSQVRQQTSALYTAPQACEDVPSEDSVRLTGTATTASRACLC